MKYKYEIIFRTEPLEEDMPVVTECTLYETESDQDVSVHGNMLLKEFLDHGEKAFNLFLNIPRGGA